MDDQAAELRELVRNVHWRESRVHDGPRLIVVSSGKSGVGSSSLAVNLSIGLSQLGTSVLLVDGDLDGAQATALCGSRPRLTLVDVLSDRATVEEIIEPTAVGPALAGGLWGSNMIVDGSPAAERRLIDQLLCLTGFECVVIDVSCGRSHIVRNFWEAADLAIPVTTAGNETLTQTYAAIKVFGRRGNDLGLQLIVNQATSLEVAQDIANRLAGSVERFLHRRLELLGWLPFDPAVGLASRHRESFVLKAPDCAASKAIQLMAARLATRLSLSAAKDAQLIPMETV